MDATLLKKIEELTLYAITAQKEIEELKQENVKLKEEILNRLKNLEKKSSMNIPLP
ncbi:hypothetical protein [Niabella hibiscisoli]|uniref:hypothetical protein n=1 Tax=Niabella hibiscisoli TaxID=1825928 RepID=UPI001F0F9FF1|nr:hypothetical protein [Niabella hibiscisoli]MCH5718215.1 hypothetical protein [Niabella hibiscisoli]